MAAKQKWPISRVVEVAWFDANSRGRWDSVESYSRHDIAPVVSVGYLLAKDAHKITVVQSQAVDNDEVADAITIPLTWIVKMKVLRK